MKQTLTLFLFFFSFSLSAQIFTNSNKVGLKGYVGTFNKSAFLQKRDTVNYAISSYCTTVNDSSGEMIFFNDSYRFYTKNGNLMPHSPKQYNSSMYPSAFDAVYMGNGLYRCYYWKTKYIYSLTVDMKMNNGNGDLLDSIPTIHYSEKNINDINVLQTDTLTHAVILVASNGSIDLARVIHKQPSTSQLSFGGVYVNNLNDYWFFPNDEHSVVKVSNNKKFALVHGHFLYDINGNIPALIKEVKEVQQGVKNRAVNSVFSPNDSFVYSFFRDDTLLTIIQTAVYTPGRNNDYVMTYKVNSNSNSNGWYPGMPVELLPNRKIVFEVIDGIPGGRYASINRPDLFGSDCQIVFNDDRFKALDSSLWIDGISAPQSFTQFGYKSLYNDCEGSMISNISDTLFKTFVWYLPNGDSLISNTRDTIKFKFQSSKLNTVVLKGVTETGYTAWFTDSVETGCFVKANFYSTDSLGCQWIAQTFVDSSCLNTYSYDTGARWTWDFGDGDITESDTPVISHVFRNSGYFKVKMILNNNGCIDSVIKEKAILIRPAPKPGFSLSGTNWCVSYSVTLTDEIGTGFTHKMYVWGDGDSIASTDSTTIFRHTYLKPGMYTIKQYLYSVSGCVSTIEQVVKIYPSYRVADAIPAPTVSVMDNSSITVRFQGVQDPKAYQIYRSDLGWFETIKDTMFLDYTANENEHKYTYSVRIVDHCNNVSLASEKENSILLTGVAHKQMNVELSANRSLISNEPHQLMTETASGEFVELVHDFKNTYTDTKFYNDSMWDRTYFIQYCSKSDTSCDRMYSNKVVFTYVPDVFIPTIISKNQNPFFVPKCTLISSGDIVIYDIMGRKVYESNNLNDPIYIDRFGQGYHVYEVNGKSRDRKDYSDRGKILLIE